MSFRVRHNVVVEIREAGTGRLLERRRTKNSYVDSGLNLIRDFLGGSGLRADDIAVGTGTSTTTKTMEALETEVFRRAIDRRVRADKSITMQILIQSTEANGNTLSEVGLFQSSKLIARALLSPVIVKTSSIEVTIAHETQVEAG